MRVLASGRFIAGPETEALENEATAALAVPHAVGVSSGTDGLLATLMACGVGPGDEVVTTPFSFFASVGSILRLGAVPVFADIDPATLNLDADAALSRLGSRTKAVLVVHLFGRAARTRPLDSVCARQQIPLIEDAAQAIGARAHDRPDDRSDGRPIGTLGCAAVLSFFPSKNLGGFGDGGMVLSRDADLAGRLRLLRAHGATTKHQHEVVGGNFRLDELQAALLRVELPLLPRWTERRRAIAARYRDGLADLPLDLPPPDPGCVWNQFVVRVPGGARNALRRHLASRDIASAVYYPAPLHLQPCLGHLGLRPGDFPQAERAAAEVLALPIYPELSGTNVDRVASALREFFF
jgi:dTDP-4-amino-4,6-dideoxygalactose transaminase